MTPGFLTRGRLRFAVIIMAATFSAPAKGDDLLPPNRPVPEVIDHYIDLKLKNEKITPAPQADDATFVRRLYLDLAGRIPTTFEARQFIESTDPMKRTKLIGELVASPEFVRYNATEFDVMLRNDNPSGGSVRGYLLAAFKENRPWDRIFRELMGVSETADPTKPQHYLTNRLKDRDGLTRDVSSVFFGLNVTCAQCHTHPYVKSLTQDYYFGMREFFATSFEIQGHLFDRKYVKPSEFKSKSGTMVPVKMMFLNGKSAENDGEKVADLSKAADEESKAIEQLAKTFDIKKSNLPVKPKFISRVKLVEMALDAENRDRFARNMVNRLWYRFYGRGLVMRPDQVHVANPPSHPELLEWLTRDFLVHKYDLKHLIAGLVASKAYSRSSQWHDDSPPATDLIAVAPVRPLTPMQWGNSFYLVNNPSRIGQEKVYEQREKLAAGLENNGVSGYIEYPRDDTPIPVSETLRLSNDSEFQKRIGGQMIPFLKKCKDRKEQIAESIWAVYSRPPIAAEYELFDSYLERRKDRPDLGLQQMLWTLLNSAEFRFNH